MRITKLWLMFKWVIQYELIRNHIVRKAVLVSFLAMIWVYLNVVYSSELMNLSIFSNPLIDLLVSILVTQLFFLYFTMNWFTAILYDGQSINQLLSTPLSKQEIAGAYFCGLLLRFLLYKAFIIFPLLYLAWVSHSLLLWDYVAIGVCFVLLPVVTLNLSLAISIIGAYVSPGGKNYRWLNLSIFSIIIVSTGFYVRYNIALRMQIASWLSSPLCWLGILILASTLALGNMRLLEQYWLKGRELKSPRKPSRHTWLPGQFYMFEREIANFFRVPSFAVNYIVMICMGAFFSFAFNHNIKLVMASIVPENISAILSVFFITQLLSTGMSSSIVAFSREGREWFGLKSLPLTLQSIFNTKLLFSTICDVLGVLPSIIILLISNKIQDWVTLCWLIPSVVLAIGVNTLLKIGMDLKFPDFTWNNPIQALRHPKRYAAYGCNLAFLALLISSLILSDKIAGSVSISGVFVVVVWISIYIFIIRELAKSQVYTSKLIHL
ncbi:hypothetical protein NYE24_10390 [Paenibacillus sp. FSL H7-0350]|uniref:hypothetical protein n=1 Tax=Paenibacillus sp. FSL H7-0350 TaxID=2975345 RepID=UPI0031590266